MAPVIAAEHLTKSYGTACGVEDLSFSVEPGEVFGFLGPNGAGKTTTIRAMLDLIRPTSGDLSVFGLRPRDAAPEIHARTEYLPGELALYEQMTGRRFLEAFASFRGGVPRARVDDLAARVSLDLTRRIASLSHGNKQKIGLVLAFAHEPELLILDEPTQGLDPLIQQEFYAMVDRARERGATVFLSSHVMPEVERVCDRVAIIREGRLVTVADVGEMKARALRRLELHFARPVPVASSASLPSVRDAEAHGDAIRAIAGEQEAGSLDLVLSTSLRRATVRRDKALSMVAGTLLLSAVLFVALAALGPPFDMRVPAGDLLIAHGLQALVPIAFGTIALVIGAATGRRTLALGVASALAVLTYVIWAMGSSVPALDRLQPLSPFRWFADPQPVSGGTDPLNVVVLAAIAAVAYAIAHLAFLRRDLAT